MTGGWVVRRAGARRSVVLTLVALVFLTSLVLAGTAGYGDRARVDALRDYFRGTGDDAALQVQARLTEDPAGQREAADEVLARLYDGLHVQILRSVVLAPEPVAGTTETLRVASYDDFLAHARITAGSWGSGAALPAAAAEVLDVGPGDTVRVGEATYEVTALWEPMRAGDPFFVADAEPGVTASLGALAVPESLVTERGESAFARWTVVPDPDRVLPSELTDLAAVVDRTQEQLEDDPAVAPRGSLAAGDLSAVIRTASRSLDAALAVRPVAPLLVAAISLLMLVQLARLLTFERRAETALVRSRGASVGQLTWVAIIEALALTVPAAALGALIPHLVLREEGGVPLLGWVLSGVAALIAVVLVAAPAAAQAKAPADRQNIDDSGRGRTLAVGGSVLLVVAGAAISTWRFAQVGSGVSIGADGDVSIDPLALVAPGLLLVAAAVVASLLFGLAARGAEVAAARRNGLIAALAARQVARRAVAFGAAVLMVSIAVGGATVAAFYARTQTEAQDRVDAMRNGATVRVDLPSADPLLPEEYVAPAAEVAALSSVRAVVPVVAAPVSVGSLDGMVTGITPGAVRHVSPAPVVEALRPLEDVGEPLAVGWLLPDETTTVKFVVETQGIWHTQEASPGAFLDLELAAWVLGPAGTLAAVEATPVRVPMTTNLPGPFATGTSELPLPELAPGSRLVGLELHTPRLDKPAGLAVHLQSVSAVTAKGTDELDVDPTTWTVLGNDSDFGLAVSGFTLDGSVGLGPATVRVAPLIEDPVPVVIDRFLASEIDVVKGDGINLDLGSARDITAVVQDVAAKLPGEPATPRIFTDAATLSVAVLGQSLSVPGANQLWLSPRDDDALVDVAAVVPPLSAVRAADARSVDTLLAPAARTLWFGAAGALLLAAIGVGSVAATLRQTRRGELVVLRSVGITARQQGRSRRRELLSVLGAGWVLGLGVGVVVVLATVPRLARSALVDAAGDAVTLNADARTWGLLVGIHVVAVLAIVVLHAEVLRREVVRATPSEVEP
ncbi:MAG TPA: hypothetical protein VFK52_04360 [Nocardioidaceae bacterium]|nr:hypothetical protein [Nocardioidaceae bacterium]